MRIRISRSGDTVTIRPERENGSALGVHSLTPPFGAKALLDFRDAVGSAIDKQQHLDPAVRKMAVDIHDAVFNTPIALELQTLRASKPEAPVLLQLLVEDRELSTVPWEAIGPRDHELGNRTDLMIVRECAGVNSPKPPREVNGPLRVLVLAPNPADASMLAADLKSLVNEGLLVLVPPITGEQLDPRYLAKALAERHKDEADVIHFIGHGGLDQDKEPVLFDAAGIETRATWLASAIETYAQRSNSLRLVYLQACQGAASGEETSAAEAFIQKNVTAVIGYLWNVHTDKARAQALGFYDALLREGPSRGDVAQALRESRSPLLADTAEGHSSVLYLNGRPTRLFEALSVGRKIDLDEPLDPEISILLGTKEGFTLCYGDLGEVANAGLRAALVAALKEGGVKVNESIPLSMVAQHYALRIGAKNLQSSFREIFEPLLDKEVSAPRTTGDAENDFIRAIAPFLAPGVHISLLWMPTLERALADQWPDANIHVAAHTGAGGADEWLVWTRIAGKKQEWKAFRGHLSKLTCDLKKDYFVLHLRGGYPVPAKHQDSDPVLTEDDHIYGLSNISTFPNDVLQEEISTMLKERPMLLVNLTALSWRHRLLLRRLFGDGGRQNSDLVILDPSREPKEAEIWERKGAVVPMQSFGVREVDIRAIAAQIANQKPRAGRR